MNIYPEYLTKDRILEPGDERPQTESLTLNVEGNELYGIVLTPVHKPGQTHPVLLMFHGYPGYCTNQDLGQMFRSMGFIVVHPFAPGAWGSHGNYTFDGYVRACMAYAEKVKSPEFAESHHVDTKAIFVFGHSMGGFAAVNTLRRIPWLAGGILLAPYDYPWCFENDNLAEIEALMDIIPCYHIESRAALRKNAEDCYKDLAFSAAGDALADRHMLIMAGENDVEAPCKTMSEPLYNKIKSHNNKNLVQKYYTFDALHCFDNQRYLLANTIKDFFVEVNKYL